jgi:hypothetical protein
MMSLQRKLGLASVLVISLLLTTGLLAQTQVPTGSWFTATFSL